MSRRLNTTIHVHKDGETFVFGPGDEVPGPMADLITAPDVWVESDVPAGNDESSGTGDYSGADEESGDDTAAPTVESDIPAGNASTAVWRAYADKNGFETDDDISRKEIIAALDAAGIPTK